MKKTQEEDYKRDIYQRRPSTFRYQRSFNHCEGNNKEKIMINQGMSSEGLHHKEDHSLPGIKVSFMVIVLLVLTLDIKL
jgi:hypothetical protein